GLPVRHGATVLLADDPRSFAAEVTRLLACSELREELGSAGRLLLEKEFTWETAWKKLNF
ncbi:MAG: glycosyl transferase family 1, partial [Candidatus Solibacter sp.]